MPLIRKTIACLVVIASIYWLGHSFIQHSAQLQNWRPSPTALLMLTVCSLIYACSGYLLSTSWRRLLITQGVSETDNLQCHIIYSRSQIAKYLPGNVFHFAGRYALGREAGISKLALIGSTFYESFGVLFAASVFSLPGLLIYQQTVVESNSFSQTFIYLIIMLVFLFILLAIIHKIAVARGIPFRQKQAIPLLTIGIIYLTFFLIFGIVAYIVISITTLVAINDIALILTAFSLAWITGFVTPGAPAGLGVREFTLVLLLSPIMGETTSFLSALLFRLVTICGDLLFFLSSFLLSYYRNKKRHAKQL